MLFQSPLQRGFLCKAEFPVQCIWEFAAEWFSAWMPGCYLLHLMQSFSFNMSSVLHQNQLHIVQRKWLHALLVTSSITLCNEMLSFYGLSFYEIEHVKLNWTEITVLKSYNKELQWDRWDISKRSLSLNPVKSRWKVTTTWRSSDEILKSIDAFARGFPKRKTFPSFFADCVTIGCCTRHYLMCTIFYYGMAKYLHLTHGLT